MNMNMAVLGMRMLVGMLHVVAIYLSYLIMLMSVLYTAITTYHVCSMLMTKKRIAFLYDIIPWDFIVIDFQNGIWFDCVVAGGLVVKYVHCDLYMYVLCVWSIQLECKIPLFACCFFNLHTLNPVFYYHTRSTKYISIILKYMVQA